jgi:hypothetical protein
LSDHGELILANTEHQAVAIDAKTGAVDWSVKIERDESSDAARGNADWGFIVDAELTDRAYVLSADGYLLRST